MSYIACNTDLSHIDRPNESLAEVGLTHPSSLHEPNTWFEDMIRKMEENMVVFMRRRKELANELPWGTKLLIISSTLWPATGDQW